MSAGARRDTPAAGSRGLPAPAVPPAAASSALRRRAAAAAAGAGHGAGPRGWRGPGRGAAAYVEAPPEWRGTTVQVCGLWPFSAGSGTPMVGVPVGRHLGSGATVCVDPISWFRRARLISNPSMFLLSQPGLGKSTFVRRVALGLVAQGVTPLVLGDLKPDYADLVAAVGGQVIPVSRGTGGLNPLDPGALSRVVSRLPGEAARRLRAQMLGRQVTITAGLVELVRRARLADHEESALAAAIGVLNDRHGGVPVLGDLVDVIAAAPEPVRAVLLDRGDEHVYAALTDRLQRSLLALTSGAFGDVFAGRTRTPLDLAAPAVCLDTSAIADTDERLQAAALLACWNEGFSAVLAAQALTDAGLSGQRIFFAVLDELWRVLRAGEGMVDRIDGITRLNRQKGLGQAMVTHTMKDLDSLPAPADRMKARGFLERAGIVVMGGLTGAEMGSLREVVALSRAEGRLVTQWASPPAWDAGAGTGAEPPGLGKFLVKVGGRPGIPLRVQLTAAERAINDTNRLWAIGGGPGAA